MHGEIPKRPYRDDVELSIIGLGGIVMVGMAQEKADRTVAESIERGVNYFDVGPSYGCWRAPKGLRLLSRCDELSDKTTADSPFIPSDS